MAVSQNGWQGITSGSSPSLTNLQWITGKVRAGDVFTVFQYLGREFNNRVEGITAAHSWGWNYRAIRGATSLSNHASGTAVDFNAPKHPLGKSGTFTAAQVATIRAIVNDINNAGGGPTIRWGGEYSGRKDEMHFEIVGSAANVARAAASIRSEGAKPVSNPVAAPAGRPARNIPETIATQKALQGATPDGDWGDDTDMRVNLVRAALNGNFPGSNGKGGVQGVKDAQWVCFAASDGAWGPKSQAALKATVAKLQKAWGTSADGAWGAKTEAAWVAARARNYKNW